MKTAVGSTTRLGWKTTRNEELEQSRRALPKNLICPLPYRITKASGSEDLQTAACARRVETSEEEEERACGTSLLTHLPRGATPHLIYWSTPLPTFHVRVNLGPTSCLCAANKLGCISYELTHMDFEIYRNF
jgi:hypothetical protein